MELCAPLVYKMNENGAGPELLQQVFTERGWVEHNEHDHEPDEWHLWWRTSGFRTGEYCKVLPWQHLNHYPRCTAITRKDGLCRNFKKMKTIHGHTVYDFVPTAFNLPNDYTKFVAKYASLREERDRNAGPDLWICKPAESSRGRGIFIFHELSDLQYDCNAVVQQYIPNPLLIGGYKFDLRVYVVVPSFRPLQIYVHEEGLVRFSTEKYDKASLDNIYAHLTNTSINKFSPEYMTKKEEVGQGCKWTISQLRSYFSQNSVDDSQLWKQITDIIILTILMQAPSAPKASNCFELYGFDILIDTNIKPWLLEVNFSPSLTFDCKADLIAKKSMLSDLIDLIFTKENIASLHEKRNHHKLEALKSKQRSRRQNKQSKQGNKEYFYLQNSNSNYNDDKKSEKTIPNVFDGSTKSISDHALGNNKSKSASTEETEELPNFRRGSGKESYGCLSSSPEEKEFFSFLTTNSDINEFRNELLNSKNESVKLNFDERTFKRVSRRDKNSGFYYKPVLCTDHLPGIKQSSSDCSIKPLGLPPIQAEITKETSPKQSPDLTRMKRSRSISSLTRTHIDSPLNQQAEIRPQSKPLSKDLKYTRNLSPLKQTRDEFSKEKSPLDTTKIEAKVGNFFLTFPFNKKTKVLSESLDTKEIVKQIHKHSKTSFHCRKRQIANLTGLQVHEELRILWAPFLST